MDFSYNGNPIRGGILLNSAELCKGDWLLQTALMSSNLCEDRHDFVFVSLHLALL